MWEENNQNTENNGNVEILSFVRKIDGEKNWSFRKIDVQDINHVVMLIIWV